MEDTILEKLHDEIRKILKRAADIATRKNYRLYIVGGAVRDYFMSIPPVDVDIVVEGNGIELAKELACKSELTIVVHEKFLTATLGGEGVEIDFSTARKEIYKKPAALPDVFPSTIDEDLKRRDFTINAIAISLNKNNFLEIIDPSSALKDIKNKVIRVLHDRSFIDDPTRAFRAVRYMTRFGFKIDKHTEELIYEAQNQRVFDEITPSRIFNEIKLLLSEKTPKECLKNLQRFNLLKIFSDVINIDKKLLSILSKIPQINQKFGVTEQWRVCLIALCSRLSADEIYLMTKRYQLDRRLISSLNQLDRFKKSLKFLSKKTKNSQLFSALKNFSNEVIIYGIANADSSNIECNLKKFIESIKKIPPVLNGDDLKKAGIPPGVLYNRILQEVHLLYLDDRIKNRRDAILWVKSKFLVTKNRNFLQ